VRVALVVGALSGCLVGGVIVASCEQGREQDVAGVARVATLLAGIPQHGASLGDPAAPVTLHEFSDLQCPHCRDFALETLPVLVERYVRPGKLQLVFHNLPILGPDSERAARAAAAAAKQDRMWQLVDVFFWNQGAEGSGYVTDELLYRLANAVPGLDARRAMLERDGPEAKAVLDESERLAEAHHVRATPTFLLGRTGETPHELEDARAARPDTFTRPIDELLASPSR
jgi:protein-disulfide isomerase